MQLDALAKAIMRRLIVPLIELLFESTGLSIQDVDGFALSNGPGSFTGLRIGLSTVKGLAYGSKLPVVAISTLLRSCRKGDGL